MPSEAPQPEGPQPPPPGAWTNPAPGSPGWAPPPSPNDGPWAPPPPPAAGWAPPHPAPPSSWDPGFARPAAPTFAQQNKGSLIVLGMVAFYFVLAQTIGIVLLGIAPAMMSFRVVQRREPLRWIAVAAAGLAVVMAARSIG